MRPLGQESGELTSWQEIADYLGVTQRTAQKWRQTEGLPVRQLGARGRVTASPAELDAWKQRHFKGGRWWARPQFQQRYGAAVTLLAALLLLLLARDRASQWRIGPPANLRAEGRQAIALDRDGREVWRYTFPEQLRSEYYPGTPRERTVWFADVDGEPGTETLLVYQPISSMQDGTPLYCLDAEGRARWEFRPGRTAVDGEHRYEPPYHIRNFFVVDAPPPETGKWVIVSSAHHLDYPCQVAALDHRGRLLGEFWHAGHLTEIAVVDLEGDGRPEVLLGGVNMERRQATLVALSLDGLAGSFHEPRNAPVNLQDLRPDQANAVLFFPRSPFNLFQEEFNFVAEVRVYTETIEVQVQERRMQRPHAYVTYVLDRNLAVRRTHAWDTLANLHRDLASPGLSDDWSFEEELEELRSSVEYVGANDE